MSADEFDPAIERLFAQAPQFPDSVFFEADVAARLNKASRFRSAALSVAGLAGGVIAVRELLNVNFSLGPNGVSAQAGSGAVDSVGAQGGMAFQSLLERSGLGDAAFGAMGSMGGMQMFWVTAGVLVALLAAGVVKLSQQI
jgi:hypothetical protein